MNQCETSVSHPHPRFLPLLCAGILSSMKKDVRQSDADVRQKYQTISAVEKEILLQVGRSVLTVSRSIIIQG